jgi:rod shape-determining protein MreC
MALYRRARSTRLLVIGLVMVSLVTITLDFRGGDAGPLAGLGRTALGVIGPLQEAVSNVFRPVTDFIQGVTRIGSLRAENQRLQEELVVISRQLQEVTKLRAENEELSKLFGLTERLQIVTIGAEVIGESVSNFEYSVFINKGADDGLVPDMPVVGPEGLLGKVVRVSASSSSVLLIIDPDFSVGVRLAASGETGVLVGRREHDLLFDLVDPGTTVRPGELVETSGLGGVFPAGIPVGVVSFADADEASLDKHVLVRPNVDFSALRLVAVVRAPVAGEGQSGSP